MGSYYDEEHRLDIDRKRVLVFTLKSATKKNYYVRILKREGKGYFQKSLKTDKLPIAKERAVKLYMEMWNTEEKGVEFVDGKFSPLFREFLEEGGMGAGRLTRAKSVFGRYFQAFFKEVPISQIDGKMFNDYMRWRVDYWTRAEEQGVPEASHNEGTPLYHYAKVPALTTLKGERQLLKQFLYYCAENRYIERVPHLKTNFQQIKGLKFREERRRAKALPPDLEGKIERALRKFCLTNGQKDKNKMRAFGRARLYYFIYICKHTLIRPSREATGLRWKDITIEDSRKHDGLKLAMINVMESKTGKPRMCVMPYGQLKLLTDWRELSRQVGMGKPGDWVFPKWSGDGDGTTRVDTHIIGKLLRDKLVLWNLHRTEDGKVVTLYSIARHTGITRRIEKSNWDVGQVATAAGTSIQQISTFYYEAFVNQNPDRWAITFRSGVPTIEEKKRAKIKDAVEEWENTIASFGDDDEV